MTLINTKLYLTVSNVWITWNDKHSKNPRNAYAMWYARGVVTKCHFRISRKNRCISRDEEGS